MLFNSLNFALFLAVTYALFLLTPARGKAWLLLGASFFFYGCSSVRAAVTLAVISLLCYWGGAWLARAEDQSRRQRFRLTALLTLLGALLLYFKFVPLLADSLRAFTASAQAGRVDFFLLFVPVGFSYYIFQGIGYLVDIYWGKPQAKNLRDFLLFMAFFPKVMMGPIERGDRWLPQLAQLNQFRFDYDRFREGCLLFVWGLFKKLVVAERLAMFVNEIYRNPSDTPGLPVGLAMAAFTFQLYSDFSGYTDMALGVGKLFGLELTPNFDRPFAATNIQDFWRRWHMSFSRWIGDYIFLPLRMSWRRGGKLGLLAAIMVTFFLVGVWHGTGWAFAIFGLVQGIYMAGSTFTLAARNKFWETRGQRDKLWLVTSRRVTTFAMVTLSLVFFRANTIPDAFGILKCVFAPMNLQTEWLGYTARASLRLAVVTVAAMETAEYFFRDTAVPFARLLARPLWQRWTVYILVLLGIVVGGVFASAQRFIYNAF